ncbi:MAG TPA: MFS transporter [Candidatus Limnocylindrales bacterium]|nr:MFS transporter [Candidatus Limnocylindrales bacterium]
MTFGRPSVAALAGFKGWSALGHRNYRLYFGGQLVSLVGTWMMSVAQSWLVLELTGNAFILGLVAAVQFTPVLILGLFGGIIADVWPKRRVLVLTQGFAAILSFAMTILVFTGVVQVWHVFVIALLLGIRNSVDMPTRQAFAVEMVGREDIGNAVALNSAIFNSARVVGPALAGLAIGVFGVALAFFIDAVSYLAVIGALLAMDEDALHVRGGIERPDSVSEVTNHLREGLGYVRSTPIVLLAIAVIGIVSTFGMNFSVVMPPLTQLVLHSDATGYGFLMAATGVGSLLAALTIAFSGKTGPLIIGAGALLLGIAEVVVGVSRSYGLSLVAMFFAGVGAISMAATCNTVIQLTVPDRLRGRVMSVYTTVFAGSTPIGGPLMGWVASAYGPDISIGIGGLASGIAGIAALGWLRGHRAVADRASAAIGHRSVAAASAEGAEVASATLSRVAPR